MLLCPGHSLVPDALTGYIRPRVSGCGLQNPGLSLAQRLEGLFVGTAFGNSPLPATIPHHGLNLAIHTVAIYLTALFRQGHAREEEKEQGQQKLSQHVALHVPGSQQGPEGWCNQREPIATGRTLPLSLFTTQIQD
jgi:hypothetical protein